MMRYLPYSVLAIMAAIMATFAYHFDQPSLYLLGGLFGVMAFSFTWAPPK